MRPRRACPLALAAVTLLAVPATAAAASVAIDDFAYAPAAVTVQAGETVTWVNDGPTDHTATGSGFDTGRLAQGQSASHAFATAGTFAYRCTLHPFMKGTVTVVAASGAAGAPAPSATIPIAPASGPALPRTGLDAPARAAIGVLLLAAGLALRRTMRA